ncbi:MAG: hypothetical protein WAV76_04475 [Bacteroidota bacterium]
MEKDIIISIDWKYLVGIGSVLIVIIGATVKFAWYANGRFTALEISMDWVKELLHDLKVTVDNTAKPVFVSRSPVNLNEKGEAWLIESGLKDYIDTHKEELMKGCEDKKVTNPYEVQMHVFKMLDNYKFDDAFDDKLKKFAFEKGSPMSLVRRVAGIYFRNLCLEKFGMSKEDIDKHDPENIKRPASA